MWSQYGYNAPPALWTGKRSAKFDFLALLFLRSLQVYSDSIRIMLAQLLQLVWSQQASWQLCIHFQSSNNEESNWPVLLRAGATIPGPGHWSDRTYSVLKAKQVKLVWHPLDIGWALLSVDSVEIQLHYPWPPENFPALWGIFLSSPKHL